MHTVYMYTCRQNIEAHKEKTTGTQTPQHLENWKDQCEVPHYIGQPRLHETLSQKKKYIPFLVLIMSWVSPAIFAIYHSTCCLECSLVICCNNYSLGCIYFSLVFSTSKERELAHISSLNWNIWSILARLSLSEHSSWLVIWSWQVLGKWERKNGWGIRRKQKEPSPVWLRSLWSF